MRHNQNISLYLLLIHFQIVRLVSMHSKVMVVTVGFCHKKTGAINASKACIYFTMTNKQVELPISIDRNSLFKQS